MKNFKYLFIFTISFLSAGVLWSVISIFLPKLPVTYIPPKFDSIFYNIDLTRIFTTETIKPQPIKTQNNQKTVSSLEGIKLKAVYNDGKKAFIILDDKGKSIFLDINQTYKGYKLIKVYNSYAVFEKNSKQYILSFNSDQSNQQIKNKIKQNKQKFKINSNKKIISKHILEEYRKNFSKIWNEIGIIRAKSGYKITYIKKGSVFDKLGLKRGDIIIKVNGIKLKNDAEAWYLYNHIDKYNHIEIEIKRHNKTKVIDYEIN
ncbi:hypothetical protein C3L23_00040 [Nautilia sp. PV-1]|uniref:PDZ domain-containing protein n=1 Tax=Nautilia sp. PV-1 TaxID=2579250 RepID=UPI000FDC44BD|nr:PDZ domain-containing protein [Nautilia sp. PV-1]AZV45722.1 hypothetical protein C3L23_00040 [Nautilia sp. PV-1]